MNAIYSADQTRIAYHRTGSGPPLVLVAGTGAANPMAWTGVIPALAQRFTVYAVDRRGRGESGDGPVYAIEREFEDIAAVVNSVGEPAHLFGHSFGALCALEAALLTRSLRSLSLYEPWLPAPGESLYPQGLVERIEGLLKSGDLEGVLTAHYQENVGMSADEVAQMQASPQWPDRLATAPTLPREMRAEEQYRFDPRRFARFNTPTLLLLGGESPPQARQAAETIQQALPASRTAVLPGQEHIAMYTAPDLLLGELLPFLAGAG